MICLGCRSFVEGDIDECVVAYVIEAALSAWAALNNNTRQMGIYFNIYADYLNVHPANESNGPQVEDRSNLGSQRGK